MKKLVFRNNDIKYVKSESSYLHEMNIEPYEIKETEHVSRDDAILHSLEEEGDCVGASADMFDITPLIIDRLQEIHSTIDEFDNLTEYDGIYEYTIKIPVEEESITHVIVQREDEKISITVHYNHQHKWAIAEEFAWAMVGNFHPRYLVTVNQAVLS